MTATILIRGAGDLASGVALRMFRAGLQVVMTELEQPLAVRRGVAFAEAIHAGHVEVEGVSARRIKDPGDLTSILNCISSREIPVLIDPDCTSAQFMKPLVAIDARMTKTPPEPLLHTALLYIGLGPGFIAPANCDAVIETERGHSMGRVIWQGAARKDSMRPDEDARRVLRAPVEGTFRVHCADRPAPRTRRDHRLHLAVRSLQLRSRERCAGCCFPGSMHGKA